MRKAVVAVAAAIVPVVVGVLAATPAAAAGGVMIYRAYYDSPGTDNRTNGSLNAEYVMLRNTSTVAKVVTGWTLRDKQNHVYKFPATQIGPGQYLTVRTGKGTNNTANRYWGSGNYIWNNTGDTAYLRTQTGALVDSCVWGSTGSWKNC
jgi:lamin tail-like protein